MFDSIFSNNTTISMLFLMVGVSLIVGIINSVIVSLRLRTSKGFFITASLMPLVVALAIALTGAFLEGSTSTTARIVTIAVSLGLIRFRSNNGKAEEMLVLFSSVVSGLIFGLGYVAYGVIFSLLIALVYVLLSYLPLFKNKQFAKEKNLKITIPESLNYYGVFDATFVRFLKEHELVGVKTTGMGSMYRLTYRIILKNPKEEKQFIDELRIRNGNLEISILPYVEDTKLL